MIGSKRKPVRAILVGALVLVMGTAITGAAGTPAKKVEAAAELTADIEVTVRHLDGSVETYSREVATLELVVDASSEIRYVHMVLVSGREKDTHCWYNYRNLAGLTYRFLAITGKGKVSLKQLGTFDVLATKGLRTKIKQVSVDDYK